MAVLGHGCLGPSVAKVQRRTAYLLSRSVESLNKQRNLSAEGILNRIPDSLELSPPENGEQW